MNPEKAKVKQIEQVAETAKTWAKPDLKKASLTELTAASLHFGGSDGGIYS